MALGVGIILRASSIGDVEVSAMRGSGEIDAVGGKMIVPRPEIGVGLAVLTAATAASMCLLYINDLPIADVVIAEHELNVRPICVPCFI